MIQLLNAQVKNIGFYDCMIKVDFNGVMGKIEIPAINVNLPVRGTRIEYIPNMEEDIVVITTPLNVRLMIVIGFSVLFVLIILFYWYKKQHNVKAKNYDKRVEQEYEDWQKDERL